MQDLDDLALLREYAANNSEAAFAELVSRRVGFVYSAALRQVRDPHLAEEITQAVFVILAQKAGKISDQTILAGWLFKTTRYAAIAQTREIIKRRQRELEVQMQTELSSAAPDPLWERMSPLLDEALASLGETDRQAVLLRFFENKSLAEVGSHLGTGEDTARKRVTRALEKLHRFFNKRGVSSTTAIIAGAMSANSVSAAPVALAKSVTTIALAKGAAASGSTLTLIKGALKIMAWAKAKTAVVVGVGVLLAAGTTTVTVKHIRNPATKFSATDSAQVDDSYFFPNSEKLFKLPPTILIFHQSHFPDNHGSMTATVGGFANKQQCRIMGAGQMLPETMALLYQISKVRMILPPDAPLGRFDFMATLPATNQVQQCQRLQAEMTRQTGLAGHKETRVVDALLLRVKTPNASGLSLHATEDFGMESKAGKIYCNGQTLETLAYYTEYSFKQIAIDRTGLTNRYDFVLDDKIFNGTTSREVVEKYLLDHFGLELVPSREPIEMLVVEKMK